MQPSEKYQSLITQGDLKDDTDQRAVLVRLDGLYHELQSYRAKSRWHLSGLFGMAAPRPRGLYIFGGVGRGKSMLMDLFFTCAKVEKKRRVHFHAFMQEIQDDLAEVRKTGAMDALKPVATHLIETTTLLCFDEMHITDIADAMIVGRLFDALFDGGVIIVATANPAPRDLYKGGLNRAAFLPFIDLIEQNLIVHNLDGGADYRMGKLRGATRYFIGGCEKQIDTQIDTLWRGFADTDAPRIIKRKGREVQIPQFHNAHGRGRFADFCQTPLGPGDYLAIAQACRVLFITDIPILTASDDSAAKRFITMIDTLYEAQVNVIISAAAPPDKLYQGKKLAFEFQRTASRLYEMQGTDWGTINPNPK